VTNPKGTKLETAIANYLITRGWPYAKRIPKGGARDKGDVTLGDGFPVTIQAKDRKGFEMAETQRGLKDQMHNAGVPWGFAVHKKRGTTKVGEYYAVLPVDVMMDILELAILHRQQLAAGARAAPAKRRRVIPRYEDP
jgi:hypothetical protein